VPLEVVLTGELKRGQGMVEFALILPLLLLIVFGVFEFSRLMIIYSSVATASREAARYGAAVGAKSATDPTPRFRDCEGIRAAAKRVGFLAGITDTNIEIFYDRYNSSTGAYDPLYSSCSAAVDLQSGDRINVVVTVQYQPVFPLVRMPSFPLRSRASRSVLRGVAVGPTGTFVLAPSSTPGPSPTFTPKIPTSTPTPLPTATFTPTEGPTPTPSNTPTPWPTPTPTFTSTPTLTSSPTATPSHTPTLTPTPVCDFTVGALNQGGSTTSVSITNEMEEDQVISSIVVDWVSQGNRQLKEIQLDSTTIWSGTEASSPAVVILTSSEESRTIEEESTQTLTLLFSKSTSVIALTVNFTSGCSVSP